MLLSHMMPLLPKKIYCGIKSVKLKDEHGLGTIEMVVLMAVLIGIAIMSKGVLVGIFTKITGVINGAKYDDLISN